MKKLILLLIFLQVCYGFGQSISLKQAVENGLKMSPEIGINELNANAGELGLKKAKRNRLFKVSVSGLYRYQSLVPELDMAKILGSSPFVAAGAQSMGAYNNYDFSVKVIQPVYTGGSLLSAVRFNENVYASSEKLRDMAVISKSADIKQTFYSYRLFQQKKTFVNALINQLQLHLKQLNELYSEGMISKADILETETKIDEMLLKIDDLQNEIYNRKALFKSLCGIEVSRIDTSAVEPDIEFKDAKEYFLRNNPVVKSLDYIVLAREAAKRAVAGSYYPNIAGFFEYHYAKPGIDFFNDKWNRYFFAGVSLNMHIFQWNKAGLDKSIADIQVKKAERKRDKFIRDQEVKIEQLFNRKKSIKAKIKRAESIVKKSEERVKLLLKLYKEGQIAHIEYLRALEQQQKYESMVKELGSELNLCNVAINASIGLSGEQP